MVLDERPYEIRKRWLLLIALLLNLFMLLFFFILEFDHDIFSVHPDQMREEPAPVVFDQLPPQPPQPEIDTGEVAALKARKSIFGATDQEQEEAEFQKGITDSATASEDGTGQQLEAFKNLEPEQDEELEIIPQETPDQPKIEEQEIVEQQETAEKKDEGDAPILEPKPELPIKKEEVITEKAEPLKAKPTEHIETLDKAKARKRRKRATRNNTSRGTKNAAPIKKMTFSDLAQGFIESFKDEGGDDWLSRDGNPNIRPHLKEMKYLSYMQKLLWHIQSTVKQNKIMNQQGWPANLVAVVNLQFDRDGNIYNLYLGQSSGQPDYDEYCLSVFRTNNSGYPRIPAHIPDNTITVPLHLIMSSSADYNRLRFSYL